MSYRGFTSLFCTVDDVVERAYWEVRDLLLMVPVIYVCTSVAVVFVCRCHIDTNSFFHVSLQFFLRIPKSMAQVVRGTPCDRLYLDQFVNHCIRDLLLITVAGQAGVRVIKLAYHCLVNTHCTRRMRIHCNTKLRFPHARSQAHHRVWWGVGVELYLNELVNCQLLAWYPVWWQYPYNVSPSMIRQLERSRPERICISVNNV